MLNAALRGAKIHNLKNVDLDVRPGEVLVLTGVSGSGKSSLALDTLYAEGQRRFVESFSPYARQFLERLERPPMDSLAPVGAGVSVDRSAPVKSSRSTVATMADLEAYLAGLFAKESVPHCPEHHLAAVELDMEEAVRRLQERFSGRGVLITYRIFVETVEEFLAIRERLLADGLSRLVCAGEATHFDELKPSRAIEAGRIYVVLDRLTVKTSAHSRMKEAFELAFSRSKGILTPGQAFIFDRELREEPLLLRHGWSCPSCARELLPPRPGYFSYESPLGACENCRGFGRVMGVDLDKVVPDERLSLADGAIKPWRGPKSAWERKQLESFCKSEGIDFHAPWSKLSQDERERVVLGQQKRGRKNYWGVLEWFSWLETKAYKMHVRVFLSRYRSYDPCPVCEGTRLTEQSRWYKWGGYDLGQWHELEIEEAHRLLAKLEPHTPHGKVLHRELSSRLHYLVRVGLGYLTLNRQSRTLSGGESQRITLTAALGTSLHNALFVLDEPTVGLHAADVAPLAELVRELAARNNAVIVIEHEPLLIQAADRVVELGPGAGDRGGRITFDGSVSAAKKGKGATARALAGLGPKGRESDALERSEGTETLRLSGASGHNLQDLSAELPLGKLVAVTGPSGSGKSSLLVDTVYRRIARDLGDADVERPLPHTELEGLSALKKVELVDQSPLGRTSRGNPATYTKAWDVVRKVFSETPEAQALGFSASHFSFNVAGGRCETCAGEGHETVEMQFLADVSLVCPVCGGRRFKDEVLTVRYRGRSIADMLQMTVEEALRVFTDSAAIRRALTPLVSLGLGYVRLGQPLSTLSGGEAQRLKLARALASPKPGTLYVLDEPSAGLHVDEIALLIDALRVLVRSGGSVFFVDHDLSLISAADHVVELGPGGGAQGGRLQFSGSVAQLQASKTATGRALSGAMAAPRRTKRSARKGASQLSVRGAREHTLKHVDVSIPHGQLTLVTGPSGSGKSTLAFDVVFAEGQRRFLETLTPYARRFLPTLPRPDVDAVEGVPPSIALEQRTTKMGTRSTVATVTEVAHYLRLAYAKLGLAHCPDHDQPIGVQSVEQLWSKVIRMPGRGALLAPVVVGRKGSYADVFTHAQRAGFEWAVADGARVSTDSPPRLAKSKEHSIDVVVVDDVQFSKLSLEQLQLALRWGQGNVRLQSASTKKSTMDESLLLSLGGTCPSCSFSMVEMDPRYFSFNTIQGRCPQCEGTGKVASSTRRGRSKKTEAPPRVCPACEGSRLSPFSRKVTLDGVTLVELLSLNVAQLAERLETLHIDAQKSAIFEPIIKELRRRLSFLQSVGLSYLTLDRDAVTLSGGELQRLRLAAQLGADLTGALYVLDEPSIGLHPRDTHRLLDNLRQLVDTGSTVIMVEHDEDAIRAADYLIDMGPGGGSQGGQVMVAGAPDRVLRSRKSPTGRALGRPITPRSPVLVDERDRLVLEGARDHNLRGEPLPLVHRALNVVVGVSGSGKSTLIRGQLLVALQEALRKVPPRRTMPPRSTAEQQEASKKATSKKKASSRSQAPTASSASTPVGQRIKLKNGLSLSGLEGIHRAIAVDQSPIGRTPRSVPATFLGIFDHIRQLFAKSPQAQVLGFSPARFSFNTPAGGRCTTCDGQGALSHEMSFLPDVVTACPACNGARFEERTLEVHYLGKSIGDVLGLSASEAVELFAAHPKIVAPLQVLCDLGAGYITLGQGSHTLSGGEAQRLKLAAELAAGARHEPTLYVLDEPTTGLHVSDVDKLVQVLSRLVDRGDTLVVIEHQPDVIRAADWIVELGPEAGPEGGRVVFSGPVTELKRQKTVTAEALF